MEGLGKVGVGHLVVTATRPNDAAGLVNQAAGVADFNRGCHDQKAIGSEVGALISAKCWAQSSMPWVSKSVAMVSRIASSWVPSAARFRREVARSRVMVGCWFGLAAVFEGAAFPLVQRSASISSRASVSIVPSIQRAPSGVICPNSDSRRGIRRS